MLAFAEECGSKEIRETATPPAAGVLERERESERERRERQQVTSPWTSWFETPRVGGAHF